MPSCTFLHVRHKSKIASLTFLRCHTCWLFVLPASAYFSTLSLFLPHYCREPRARLCLVRPARDLHGELRAFFPSKHPEPGGKQATQRHFLHKTDILGHFSLTVSLRRSSVCCCRAEYIKGSGNSSGQLDLISLIPCSDVSKPQQQASPCRGAEVSLRHLFADDDGPTGLLLVCLHPAAKQATREATSRKPPERYQS